MTAAATSPARLPFREVVATEILAHLARRRLSQRAFARQVNKTPSWVNERLTGATVLDANDMDFFAEALGFTDVFDMLANVPPHRPIESSGGVKTAPETWLLSASNPVRHLQLVSPEQSLPDLPRPAADHPGEMPDVA